MGSEKTNHLTHYPLNNTHYLKHESKNHPHHNQNPTLLLRHKYWVNYYLSFRTTSFYFFNGTAYVGAKVGW